MVNQKGIFQNSYYNTSLKTGENFADKAYPKEQRSRKTVTQGGGNRDLTGVNSSKIMQEQSVSGIIDLVQVDRVQETESSQKSIEPEI